MAIAAPVTVGSRPFDPQNELSDNVRTCFFIDGTWQEPTGEERFELISPVTEELMLSVPAGAPEDIEKAVAAARRAFDQGPWPRLSPVERAAYLRRIADEIDRRAEAFQRVWIGQVGAPQWFVGALSGTAAGQFRYYADLAETYPFEEERTPHVGRLKVLREPVGVAALIIPWNAPLILLTQKMSAALAAGCTVVAKPSPETPLDAQILAECVDAAGLPPGTVNIVPAGREVGNILVSDTRIDKVSFTGSTAAGRHIATVCADRLARVALELGGKSASILCEDADIGAWLQSLAPFTMPFSGQICFSQTRVLVPRSRHDEFIDAYVAGVESLKLGDPWDAATQIGPVSMARQRDRVLDYIDIGRGEGARLVTGGGRPSGFNRGYFIAPTVFDQVDNSMRIAREEIFGPVVSVISYGSDEEAVAIANDSDFGLSGSVYSTDVGRAEAIARRIRTGHISVNGFNLDAVAPFGGYKKSGLGRESGPEGLAGFLEIKSMFLPA
ncbi:aldehyde dehydrogenase [Novosphingobium sp.]|uniref:aldehyde dehydrogenase n=1 Tax=Novosphingobium sp. TaxID=1874826 RepID=UPI002B48BD5A|nr:aldehyde dehydrogenase [Novosphingobium sp.]HKR93114.1 aldehyde dehydrogenase [Novosphingobium sp.]